MSLDFENWFENLDKCTEAVDDYQSALMYVVEHKHPCCYHIRHEFSLQDFEEDSRGDKFINIQLPYNDNDYIENILVKGSNHWAGKVEVFCAGRRIENFGGKFLYSSAMYTPLEIKIIGELQDIEITYKS